MRIDIDSYREIIDTLTRNKVPHGLRCLLGRLHARGADGRRTGPEGNAL